MKTNHLLTTLLFCSAATLTAADKSQYHLFKPTLTELMRPMSTDRPDTTESPYTVDAGHFQIEADFINYSLDRETRSGTDTRTRGYTAPGLNLKAGLLNNVDLQIVIDSYVYERVEDRVAGTSTRNSGFGDLQTRLKINLFGNDEGPFAIAVMPFAKWPTASTGVSNGAVEGGIIVPVAFELPGGWGLGAQTEFDFLEDGTGSGYHTEFLNTIAIGHDIVGPLAGYTEFISLHSNETGAEWKAALGMGFTYGINDNVQLDCGVNVGLNAAADDFNPFCGISWRF